jgi:hypothetical protein
VSTGVEVSCETSFLEVAIFDRLQHRLDEVTNGLLGEAATAVERAHPTDDLMDVDTGPHDVTPGSV